MMDQFVVSHVMYLATHRGMPQFYQVKRRHNMEAMRNSPEYLQRSRTFYLRGVTAKIPNLAFSQHFELQLALT